MKSDFEEVFDEYHNLIRKEIAKDTDLDNKLSKVEQLVFLMDSLVRDRLSDDYRKKALEFRNFLRVGRYLDEELGRDVLVNYNQANTKRNRLALLRKWLSLMLMEEPRFKLFGNLNRVDFGD